MLAQIYNYFDIETIYLWLNYGVLPMWFLLIFFPKLKINQIFITSIFLPLLFSAIYIYIFYQLIYLGENLLEVFNLYLSFDQLNALFSNERFLLLFWIHFLGINLFLASWVSNDSIRHGIPRLLSGISLLLIYFTGPVGLVIYWFIRIFFAKKISLHD